jgi:sugar-specific transcriptional regulator TrmB
MVKYKEASFTQYEAETFLSTILNKNLSVRKLSEESGVRRLQEI